MPWPTPQDYSESVQSPLLSFSDSELKKGQVEVNNLGLPKPCSGAFAVVFKIKTLPESWAVKCFTSEVLDQQRRYDAISIYLSKISLPYTVPFTYFQNGIRVSGNSYPLLKMQWIQGESLISFIARSLNYPETMLSLAKVWAKMVLDLKAANIAHGDLQHGNIVVVGDELKLIDYDGMYVPALAGQRSNEIGHRNYQLPSRSSWDYGPYIDNFSAWVIYVSLVALAAHPELWSTHNGGDECIIFRKEDFVNPNNSKILRDLKLSPNDQLRLLVEIFTSLFSLSPQDVPSLDGNLPMIVVEPPKPWWGDYSLASSHEENAKKQSPALEPGPKISDPSWIIDSLTEGKQVEHTFFKNNFKEIRLVAASSVALVLLARLLNGLSVSEFYLTISGVFGLNLLFCFVHYRRDPSHNEFEGFKRELKNILRQVRESQTIQDSIFAERLSLQEKLAQNEREFTQQKNGLNKDFQNELAKGHAVLNSRLQSISQRRQDIANNETNKRNSLQSSLGNQISEISKRISSINQRESDEINQASIALSNYQVQYYLQNRSIVDSSVPGIGATYKSRLMAAGIRTAADIDWRVTSVSGIGPTKRASLLAWRQLIEDEARRNAPPLPAQQKLTIENKYRDERKNLGFEKQRLQTQFDVQFADIRQFFTDARQLLDQEEKQIRSAGTYEINRIQQDYNARFVDLDKNLDGMRIQAAGPINELSEKFRIAQKQVFALRWKSAKHQSKGKRFEYLRFRDYLRKVISK